MKAIIPYITFKGETKEAVELYTSVFGGEVVEMHTYGSSEMEVAKEYKDQIMHAHFRSGDMNIMFSDAHERQDASVRGNAIALAVDFPEPELLDAAFAKLAEGGIISMPVQDTFWGARYGMLSDKFGIHWAFNHDYKKD